MSFIEKNLLEGERVIFLTKKHFIIFFIPATCTLISVLSLIFMYDNPVLQGLLWIPWIISLLFWGYFGLEYQTSEFVVTNERIMMREGFFYRHVSDLRLHTISQINIGQDPLGQIFDYGTVSINAFGSHDNFSYVAKPNEFKNKVSEQLYQRRNNG